MKKIIFLLLCILIPFTSCDYLDVVPDEQPQLSDATKDAEATLGFLYSVYAGMSNPANYTDSEASADEYALPPLWGHRSHLVSYNQNIPNNPDHRWGSLYRFIGQAHLFLQELKNAEKVTEEQKTEWAAEARFMIAYYHFEVLRFYGPCPITDEYIDMAAPSSAYPGRSHYDYVTQWIVDLLDQVYPDLPDTRNTSEWGRATKTIAKALKAKVLVYAASPLWNGSFPYPEWKNKNYETPGYGYELVSKTYDRNKWVLALEAVNDAIREAESAGFELYDDEELYDREKVPLPYIPNLDLTTSEAKEFQKKVLLMRYLVTTRTNEGNKELIWGFNGLTSTRTASLPTRILKLNSGDWFSGYSGVSPFLYSIEHFYTKNGKLPASDPGFYRKSQWLESANITGREGIIKLNIDREPRFYAWFAFDDGDYSSMLANGKPLQLKMRDGEKQGYNPALFNRDHCVTGYLSQKYVRPNYNYSVNNSSNSKNTPTPLIRFADLLLYQAECHAMLGQEDQAIPLVNQVRNRAGVPNLGKSDITSEMSLIDWIRSERFIEFWGEGQRYFDLRRWAIAPQYLASGKREGLNPTVKVNPTFEQFNERIRVNQAYAWDNRMYIAPVFYNEVYKNPQMVQAPGY